MKTKSQIYQKSQIARTQGASERSVSGAGRKSGERERSGERAGQKTVERERSAERGVEERERSGERAKSGAHGPLKPTRPSMHRR